VATEGKPWLRSVDSEHAGSVIDPERNGSGGADAVEIAESTTVSPAALGDILRGTGRRRRRNSGKHHCLADE
jgi:hypothetical protein